MTYNGLVYKYTGFHEEAHVNNVRHLLRLPAQDNEVVHADGKYTHELPNTFICQFVCKVLKKFGK